TGSGGRHRRRGGGAALPARRDLAAGGPLCDPRQGPAPAARQARRSQRRADPLPPARGLFMDRARIISAVRAYLDEEGFIEVATPVLQPLYGGALARPFLTHHN